MLLAQVVGLDFCSGILAWAMSPLAGEGKAREDAMPWIGVVHWQFSVEVQGLKAQDIMRGWPDSGYLRSWHKRKRKAPSAPPRAPPGRGVVQNGILRRHEPSHCFSSATGRSGSCWLCCACCLCISSLRLLTPMCTGAKRVLSRSEEAMKGSECADIS